jgi:uncharacterized DUF497 family protein
MSEDDWRELFLRIRGFGWDNNKRERVLREREIDFDDARFVFDGPITVRRSDRKGEARYMVFGFLDDLEVVIICTLRDEVCWIISARRARRDERKKYHDRLSRRAPEGKD